MTWMTEGDKAVEAAMKREMDVDRAIDRAFHVLSNPRAYVGNMERLLAGDVMTLGTYIRDMKWQEDDREDEAQ